MTTRTIGKRIATVKDLKVYNVAFEAAMEIFNITKKFPAEERYSLVDQIRRSSRSVCANVDESWRKRTYKAVFINKLTDASQEAAETQVWLEFALRCGYIPEKSFHELYDAYEYVFAMLNNMARKSDSFCKGLHVTVRRAFASLVLRPSESAESGRAVVPRVSR